jgi:hypothetical protein
MRIQRNIVLSALALFVVVAGSRTTAQKRYPVFTVNDFANAMKLIDRNFGGLNKSLAAGDFESGKAQLTRAREQLATTITFWRHNKKDDAIKLLKETVATMDELDAALSVEKVDGGAARSLARQISGRCDSCHALYRDQDPVTKAYRLKPGSVEP